MPNVQGDKEAALEDEQVKFVGDESHPIGEEDEPTKQKVVNEDTPVNQLLCFFFFVKFTIVSCFLFLFYCKNPFENNGYVIINIANKFLGFYL